MQGEELKLRAQVSMEQTEKDDLRQDLKQKVAAAEKQVQAAFAGSEQSLRELRDQQEKALSQVNVGHHEALEAANKALINVEVRLACLSLVTHRLFSMQLPHTVRFLEYLHLVFRFG